MTTDGPGAGTGASGTGTDASSGGIDGSGSALALCVLAPNPSPMTLDGTNTWLIAAPDSTVALVVDPGPDDEGHLRRVVQQAGQSGRRIAQILLTHGHDDHSAGARRLAGLTGAPVRAADPAHRLGAEGLGDGDVIEATIIGNEIKGYINGVEVTSAVDETYLTGNPGIGFNYGAEETALDHGLTYYEVETWDD